jgi:glycosyltransferase involved in cell wall biosynthesis
MAAGLPVVAANTSSMPEVVGNAGILAEPNIGEFTAALEKAVASEKLRKAMARKSLERAKRFTWRKCAERTVKVYRAVM